MAEEADLLEKAIDNVLASGIRTADIMSEGMAKVSTTTMTESILKELDKPTRVKAEIGDPVGFEFPSHCPRIDYLAPHDQQCARALICLVTAAFGPAALAVFLTKTTTKTTG